MTGLVDKAGATYWDDVWQGQAIPDAFDPGVKTRHNHIHRGLHETFIELFAQHSHGTELLEIGAARSIWLPYFARTFGFHVSGIDYSQLGCMQAEAILRHAGVSGRIALTDFSAPPDDMLGASDVAVSFGVVEHYEDTAACVEMLARFLKPGGLMITIIPNMAGGPGWIEKRVCRSIYDVHVPLDPTALRHAHEQAGLSVVFSNYLLGAGFDSLIFSCWTDHSMYRVISRIPMALSLPFWSLEKLKVGFKPNRITSPYVICLARR